MIGLEIMANIIKMDKKVKLNSKIPIVFHNLKSYDVNLIIQELGRSDFKINVMQKIFKNIYEV